MKEDTLHREILEEHARNPHFDDLISEPTHKADYQSNKTGNACRITLNVQDGRLVQIGLKVQGSALAIASASLLFCELNEMSLHEVQLQYRSWKWHRVWNCRKVSFRLYFTTNKDESISGLKFSFFSATSTTKKPPA